MEQHFSKNLLFGTCWTAVDNGGLFDDVSSGAMKNSARNFFVV